MSVTYEIAQDQNVRLIGVGYISIVFINYI